MKENRQFINKRWLTVLLDTCFMSSGPHAYKPYKVTGRVTHLCTADFLIKGRVEYRLPQEGSDAYQKPRPCIRTVYDKNLSWPWILTETG